MRGFFIILCLLIPLSGHAAAYEQETVTAAQEALVRLGYDPGPIDGDWGSKSREAMNALREANGLPPSQSFSGSSLQLIHRLSPGATTLPYPGLVVTDFVARRKFINDDMRGLLGVCQAKVGISTIPADSPVIEVNKPIPSPNGFIVADDDWYSAIQEGLVEYQGRCLSGSDFACESILEMVSAWAGADALRSGVPNRDSEPFEDVSWIANTLLNNMLHAYATARTVHTIEPSQDAEIMDWFKRRIDDYHYQRVNGRPIGDPNAIVASNHALAHMMPAMVFGAMVGDRSMMQGAFGTWSTVLSSMRDDGSLPTETRRGARWLHYSLLQMGQLLEVQFVARAQGIELTPPSPNQSVPQLARFILAGMSDFSLAEPYAKANFGPGESQDYTIPFLRVFQFGPLPAYQAFYGDDENVAAFRTSQIDNDLCSPRGFSDDKPERFSVCAAVKQGELLTLQGFVSAMRGLIPHHGMGFHAGCTVGESVDFFEP